MELLLTNLIYVSYRLVVSGSIVKVLNKYMSYYLAVLLMAQLSFAYDTFVFGFYFNAVELPEITDYILSSIIYTVRVLVAWWVIKILWKIFKNYWFSVFIGAELTFICDYFIFKNMFF